jgi:hypothetical protein
MVQLKSSAFPMNLFAMGGVWILECPLDIIRMMRMKSIEFLFSIPDSAFQI